MFLVVWDSARQIADEIRSGQLKPAAPRTITVGWFKYLIESNKIAKELAMNGEVL